MKKIHVAVIALVLGVRRRARHVRGDPHGLARVCGPPGEHRSVQRARQTARRVLGAAPARARREPSSRRFAQAATGSVTPRVVYRRPPAIVVVKHTHHGDDGFERSEVVATMTSHTGRLYALARRVSSCSSSPGPSSPPAPGRPPRQIPAEGARRPHGAAAP